MLAFVLSKWKKFSYYHADKLFGHKWQQKNSLNLHDLIWWAFVNYLNLNEFNSVKLISSKKNWINLKNNSVV